MLAARAPPPPTTALAYAIMLPAQRNKVDLSVRHLYLVPGCIHSPADTRLLRQALSPQERTALEKYGRLPARLNGSAASAAMARVRERKFFDSGDYAMSKAGVSGGEPLGTAIPKPTDVPHAVSAACENGSVPATAATTATPQDAPTHAPAPIPAPGSGPTAGFTGRPAHDAVSTFPVAVATPSPLAEPTNELDAQMDQS